MAQSHRVSGFLGSKALLSPLCCAQKQSSHMHWSSGRPYSRKFHTPPSPMLVGGWTPEWASFDGWQPAVLDRVLWLQSWGLLGLLPATPPPFPEAFSKPRTPPGPQPPVCVPGGGEAGLCMVAPLPRPGPLKTSPFLPAPLLHLHPQHPCLWSWSLLRPVRGCQWGRAGRAERGPLLSLESGRKEVLGCRGSNPDPTPAPYVTRCRFVLCKWGGGEGGLH